MSNPASLPQRPRNAHSGPFQVSALAFGCMNICYAYGDSPTPDVPAVNWAWPSLPSFSPLARGFLSGKIGGAQVAAFDAKDIRRSMPRFTAEHYAANEKLLPA